MTETLESAANIKPNDAGNGLNGTTPAAAAPAAPKTYGYYDFPEPVRYEYDKTDAVFALLAFGVGYLFIRLAARWGFGWGALTLLLNAYAFAYLRVKGRRPAPLYYLTAAVSVAFGALPASLYGSDPLSSFAALYSLAAFAYSCYAGASPADKPVKIGGGTFFQLLRAVFVLPFGSLGAVFGAFTGFRHKKTGNTGDGNAENDKKSNVGAVVSGLALAVLPTALVIFLLSSADAAFEALVDRFTFDIGSLREHIAAFIFGIPVAMYGFGLLCGTLQKRHANVLTDESAARAAEAAAFAPDAAAIAAAAPMFAVYAAYFLSQFAYFTGAFADSLPAGFTYAEYARRGFFELCAVACVNAAVMLCVCLFTKKKNGRGSAAQRVIVCVFAGVTLLLIATAAAKMVMYIGIYGLTRLRVYVMWFLVLLAAAFIIAVIRSFAPKLNAVLVLLAVFTVMFAALTFTDVDGLIAGYNVDAYLDGRLDDVDVNAMYELSESAAPHVLRLYESEKTETEVKADVLRYLGYMQERINSDDVVWYAQTAARLNAHRLLSDYRP